jgi:lysozyme family protein
MTDRFDISVERVLDHEGGFVDHPDDKGGPTNLGITIGTARSVYGPQFDADDLKELTEGEAKAVYKRLYWDASKAGALPVGLDYCHFDAAVNSGPNRAARFLQRAVGAKADGIIGPITLEAVNAQTPASTVVEYSRIRLAFVKSLLNWRVFGSGWAKRITRVRADSIDDAEKAGWTAYVDNGGDDAPKTPTIPEPTPPHRMMPESDTLTVTTTDGVRSGYASMKPRPVERITIFDNGATESEDLRGLSEW